MLHPAQRMLLFARDQDRLRRFLRSLVEDEDLAADLLQEVGLVVMRHPTGPEDEAVFHPWCLGIARRTAAHHWRAEERRRSATAHIAETFYEDARRIAGNDPERRCALRDALDACLQGLDEPAQELIARRYVLEETPAEVADSLHQSPGAVRTRLMRLRARMRKVPGGVPDREAEPEQPPEDEWSRTASGVRLRPVAATRPRRDGSS